MSYYMEEEDAWLEEMETELHEAKADRDSLEGTMMYMIRKNKILAKAMDKLRCKLDTAEKLLESEKCEYRILRDNVKHVGWLKRKLEIEEAGQGDKYNSSLEPKPKG